jgi:hypothetical protein
MSKRHEYQGPRRATAPLAPSTKLVDWLGRVLGYIVTLLNRVTRAPSPYRWVWWLIGTALVLIFW